MRSLSQSPQHPWLQQKTWPIWLMGTVDSFPQRATPSLSESTRVGHTPTSMYFRLIANGCLLWILPKIWMCVWILSILYDITVIQPDNWLCFWLKMLVTLNTLPAFLFLKITACKQWCFSTHHGSSILSCRGGYQSATIHPKVSMTMFDTFYNSLYFLWSFKYTSSAKYGCYVE